ncbi:MAG: hypothetical protein MJK15_00780 [Colwellia sp.]|nr:hypothetical protein [Colwellia sp.]
MSYQIVITSPLDETKYIDYDSYPQAVQFLRRMLIKFPSQTTPITTDLGQLSGVKFPLTGSLYTIKKG